MGQVVLATALAVHVQREPILSDDLGGHVAEAQSKRTRLDRRITRNERFHPAGRVAEGGTEAIPRRPRNLHSRLAPPSDRRARQPARRCWSAREPGPLA